MRCASSLNRVVRASCFDAEAERAGVSYTFVDVEAQSWRDVRRRETRKTKAMLMAEPVANATCNWMDGPTSKKAHTAYTCASLRAARQPMELSSDAAPLNVKRALRTGQEPTQSE